MTELMDKPTFECQVAYLSMEFAFVDELETYSGGLGFLAGSHMRSAWTLGQPVVAIGILWKYGYYDQVQQPDQTMEVQFIERQYTFLQPTHVRFQLQINQAPVWVTAYFLPPTTFGTAPTYFLSTDLPENDTQAQAICHRLYDDNAELRIAASIVLGIGGAKLLEQLGLTPKMYHLNESHPLPLAFHLYSQLGNVQAVRQRLVFTTHTPEQAGNPQTAINQLDHMGFFDAVPLDEVRQITGIQDDTFNWALGALRLAGRANAVSKRHQLVCQQLWKNYDNLCPIDAITNAQNANFWRDDLIQQAVNSDDNVALVARKKALKQQLFELVSDQTGDQFDPDVLTIVWARRFAGYKRAELLMHDLDRFDRLITSTHHPIQLIWAGKPFPADKSSIDTFNRLVEWGKKYKNCVVLTGYGIDLSRQLKGGADLWLNTPRMTREASGTSGMTAAMNGAINGSIYDGWIPEFARDGQNSFVLPEADPTQSTGEQDAFDAENLYSMLETVVLPLYYERPQAWLQIVKASVRDSQPYFNSDRMALEYGQKFYNL